jgi:hypothetical protein
VRSTFSAARARTGVDARVSSHAHGKLVVDRFGYRCVAPGEAKAEREQLGTNQQSVSRWRDTWELRSPRRAPGRTALVANERAVRSTVRRAAFQLVWR